MKDLGYKGRVMAVDLEGKLTVISEIHSPVFFSCNSSKVLFRGSSGRNVGLTCKCKKFRSTVKLSPKVRFDSSLS